MGKAGGHHVGGTGPTGAAGRAPLRSGAVARPTAREGIPAPHGRGMPASRRARPSLQSARVGAARRGHGGGDRGGYGGGTAPPPPSWRTETLARPSPPTQTTPPASSKPPPPPPP